MNKSNETKLGGSFKFPGTSSAPLIESRIQGVDKALFS